MRIENQVAGRELPTFLQAGKVDRMPADDTPTRDDADNITLSDEAKRIIAARGAAEPPSVTLPEILVTASKADGNAWKAKLPALKPWTPDVERQYQTYMNGVHAMAERAFELVNSSFKSGGTDLNDPDQRAAYDEVFDALLATAYAAIKNPGAFVDGPGADDFTANDFLKALGDTDIVMTGRSDTTPGQYTYDAITKRGRITLSAAAIKTTMPDDNFITAVSTSLFHELGHATVGGRADLQATFNAFSASNPQFSGQPLQNAFTGSPEHVAYEHRTTTRGLGLAGIGQRPFDPAITGWAPL